MPSPPKEKKSGFSSVDFLGDLEITDVKKFTKALFGGLGRAKAFGCGLMLVRRI
ncbi:MAG: type I-E CRISPR-associated protein Cas6/Cse3/CasE [Proteobacteria bacterium]|nr:type I-E CRISPR-associated protein Cas6/Cse3/CasE [Pseudomonadota bacterium]